MKENSAIKGYHDFHVRSHIDLEVLKMATPILLIKGNLIVGLCKMKGTLFGRKKYEWKELFTKGDLVFEW